MLMDWSEMAQAAFWLSALKIIWINILLSGDNAIVLAMACRQLPPRQRVGGMILGAGAAVVLCIAFTFVVASALTLPYLRLVGGIALIYIAARLLLPQDTEAGSVETTGHLWQAVSAVAIAETSMSLDNVIATAAAAHGSKTLLVLGLAVSIPITVAGAALIKALLDRFPILVWAGAGLLGWVAGEMISAEPTIGRYALSHFGIDGTKELMLAASAFCAVATPAIGGLWLRVRRRWAHAPDQASGTRSSRDDDFSAAHNARPD